MQPTDVRTTDDARAIVNERGLSHVQVGVTDIDGVMRGKYMAREKFISALDSGFGFCDVVLGWDINDRLYDNGSYTGWHTAYPDAPVRILPETCRELPGDRPMLFFLSEFSPPAESLCPRGLLRRIIQRAEGLGFEPYAALEYEFFVFDETPESVREKGYRNLRNATPGSFGYSVLRSSSRPSIYFALLDGFEKMDIPIEGLHTETGPGVLEAAITVDTALRAADKGALFKTFAKVIAQRHNMMATFMAKWSPNEAGQSGHIHLSLKGVDGSSLFFDDSHLNRMSKLMRHFVAGQQALMPELLAMVSPTVNSYRRLVPGYWAPTSATWGVDNRTTAIRVIPGSEKSQRVEYRIAASDANPYLALAVALGSGLWGIEHSLEPGEPVNGNAYAMEEGTAEPLPRTLWDAAQLLKRSTPARELFGGDFVDHFAASREWEEREFRKHISDWELARYFEIV